MLKVKLNLSRMVAIAACLAAATMFSSCEDKEKEPAIKVENEASLIQNVYADQTGGVTTTIVTAGAWSSTITEGSAKSTKSSTVSWLSIAPSSGAAAGTYPIVISLEPNLTGAERSATITIKCGNMEISIVVTQKTTKENGESYVKAPTLTTAEASNVTVTTATAGGIITDVGTPAYTERGVCYGTTVNPTVDGNSTKIAVSGSGTGSFAANLTGLTAETTYYARAYATNDNGTVYGNEVSFTTNAEPEKVKLLETITYNNGHQIKFEYDNQNRITKIDGLDDAEALFYNGNDLVRFESAYGTYQECVKSGNKITITRKGDGWVDNPFIIFLNDDGFPIRIENSGENWTSVTTYQYENDNMTNHTYEEWENGEFSGSDIIDYKYGNNKSPLYHCNTPKWFLFYIFCELGSRNNIIEATLGWGENSIISEYEYEYDSDGFPTKCTYKDFDEQDRVTEYKYK